MAKNTKIEKWLKSSRKDYREGLALYLEYDLEAPLKSKLVIGGNTPNNKVLLKKELERLVNLDPKKVEEKRKAIAERKAEEEKIAKINAVYITAYSNFSKAIADKNIDDASGALQKMKDHNVKGEKDNHIKELETLLEELNNELLQAEKKANIQEALEQENIKLIQENTALKSKIKELEALVKQTDKDQNTEKNNKKSQNNNNESN